MMTDTNTTTTTTIKQQPFGITERIQRFKQQADQCIRNAYSMEHSTQRSSTGVLTTSLTEDVLFLLQSEASVLINDEVLKPAKRTRTGAQMFLDCLLHVLQSLQVTHNNHKLLFLTCLEDSAATANDCFRMSTKIEHFIHEQMGICEKFFGQKDLALKIQHAGHTLENLYMQDAVMAAERTQVFILRAVQETSIKEDYFSQAWEDDWTRNEVTFGMIRIFDRHLNLARRYLGYDELYLKAVLVSAKAMTNFYVRCLIDKADAETRRRRNRERLLLPGGDKEPFRNHKRALRRMADDVDIMKQWMADQAQDNVALSRMLVQEMGILELILECLSAHDVESMESFILVLHKRTGADELVTRYLVGDLWTLTPHKPRRSVVRKAVEHLQEDLTMVTSGLQERAKEHKKDEELSFVNLNEMLKTLYEDRVAQGVLPACFACLPKVETDGDEVVIKQIRNWTRKVAEMKWGKKKKAVKPVDSSDEPETRDDDEMDKWVKIATKDAPTHTWAVI